MYTNLNATTLGMHLCPSSSLYIITLPVIAWYDPMQEYVVPTNRKPWVDIRAWPCTHKHPDSTLMNIDSNRIGLHYLYATEQMCRWWWLWVWKKVPHYRHTNSSTFLLIRHTIVEKHRYRNVYLNLFQRVLVPEVAATSEPSNQPPRELRMLHLAKMKKWLAFENSGIESMAVCSQLTYPRQI